MDDQPAAFPQQPQQINATPPPMPEPPKTFDWFKWVLVIVTITLLSSTATYLLLQSQSQKQPSPSQATLISPSPNPTSTTNLKSYANVKYAFSFSYPEDLVLNVENDIESQFLLRLKTASEDFDLEVTPAENGSFLLRGNPAVSTTTINGIIWSIVPESDYCDAGDCGKVSPAYLTKHNNRYYALILRNIKTTSLTFDQILSTFRFD